MLLLVVPGDNAVAAELLLLAPGDSAPAVEVLFAAADVSGDVGDSKCEVCRVAEGM